MHLRQLPFAVSSLLLLALCLPAQAESGLDAIARPLLDLDSLQLEAEYLVRIMGEGSTLSGHATLEYWQDGDQYRQTTTIDDRLEEAGLFGDVDYSWDGERGRTRIGATRGVGQSAAAHGSLPSAVPNPFFLMLEYLTDRPSEAERVEARAARARLDQLELDPLEDAASTITVDDGTRYDLEFDDTGRLVGIVKTLPDGQQAHTSLEQHEKTAGGIPFPRKITIRSGEEGMPSVELVILVTTFEVGRDIPSDRFLIDVPEGHNLWDNDQQALYSSQGELLVQEF